jgi:hypothetical protein
MENRFAHSVEGPVLNVDNDVANEIEPLSLSELYPKDSRDLDRLFPEPEIRKLFQDIVGDLEEVERFRHRTDKQLEREQNSDRKEGRRAGPAGWKNILSR